MTPQIDTKSPTFDERQDYLRLAHQLRSEALADMVRAAGRGLRKLATAPRLLARRAAH
ncbi:MAG: hypothetical protein WA822_13210 [Albidovulum sp.]